MSLLDQLGSVLGGQPGPNVLDRILGGNHSVHEGGSPDHQQWNQVIQQVPRDQLAGMFGQTARSMDGQQYRDHVTPGVGGTNPLGMLKGPAMAMVASALMRHLAGGSGRAAGGGGAGGMAGILGSVLGGGGGPASGGMGGLGGLLGKIPGLNTTDPSQMDASQVAALSDYARQHNPDAFGQAMADVGHQDPSVLGPLLGNQGLSSAAQNLAGMVFGGRR